MVPGAPQGSRQRETSCPKQSVPRQLRLMQRRGCALAQRRGCAPDGWVRHLCQLAPGQQGEVCFRHTAWPKLRGRYPELLWRELRASPNRRCRAALNLATSTSFRDDGESKPLGDLADRRRGGEMRIDVDDAAPLLEPCTRSNAGTAGLSGVVWRVRAELGATVMQGIDCTWEIRALGNRTVLPIIG